MKQFEDMTIGELRKLTEEFKEQNPDVPTAEELLDDLEREKDILKEHYSKK